MSEPEINVSALLRLKRYEQPPPGYYDRLLQDIHRRQRTELLRRPLWKIAVDRVQTFFSEHSMGGLSYAGAMAGVLALGVAGIGLMTPGTEQTKTFTAREPFVPALPTVSPKRLLTLQAPPANSSLLETPKLRPVDSPIERAVRPPRYIIDSRPVSYEPPPSL